jgi:hypothetical protein
MTEPAAEPPAYVVQQGRGPRIRTLAGHDGGYFDVIEAATGQRVARYVTEDRAAEYAAGLNSGEIVPVRG